MICSNNAILVQTAKGFFMQSANIAYIFPFLCTFPYFIDKYIMVKDLKVITEITPK